MRVETRHVNISLLLPSHTGVQTQFSKPFTHIASASPFQDLLGVILSDVFLKCLPANNLARMRRKQAPLNVSHVCRHWPVAIRLALNTLFVGTNPLSGMHSQYSGSFSRGVEAQNYTLKLTAQKTTTNSGS